MKRIVLHAVNTIAIYNLDHSAIVCLMEYPFDIIMDNAQEQSFDIFACLFIRIGDIEQEYVDSSDHTEDA